MDNDTREIIVFGISIIILITITSIYQARGLYGYHPVGNASTQCDYFSYAPECPINYTMHGKWCVNDFQYPEADCKFCCIEEGP